MHLFTCSPLIGLTALKGNATITTRSVRRPNDTWVAEKDGKILWSYRRWGNRIEDCATGVTILGSTVGLLVIDKNGIVRRKLETGSINDPRSLLVAGGYIVYNNGSVALGKFEPRSEGRQVYEWLKETRTVFVYSIRENRLLSQAPEVMFGLPLSLHKDTLYTIKALNLKDCLQDSSVKPQIVALAIDARTGQEEKRAHLTLTTAKAKKLLGWMLNPTPFGSTEVHWSAHRALIPNFFGDSYSGRILND